MSQISFCPHRAAIVMATVLVGCGSPAPGTRSSSGEPGGTGRVSQNLYASGASMWPRPDPGSTLIIPVCWQDPPGPDVVRNGYQISENQLRAWTRDSVELGWQRYGNVSFTGWGICPADFTGIRVEGTTPGNPNTAFSSYTHRNDPTPWMHLNYIEEGTTCANTAQMMENCARYYALHEFGHAIGFVHEDARPDYTGENCLGGGPSRTGIYYGAYDPDSIMNDCLYIHNSAPNLPTTLSAGDIAGVQEAYGRRPHGSIVTPRGDCLSGPTSCALAEIRDCVPDAAQIWGFGAQGQLSTFIPGNFPTCLDSRGPTDNGDIVGDFDCADAPTQQWSFQGMYLRGWGGLCLDLQYGDTTNGNIVQMWHCGDYGGVNQRWTIPGDGSIRFGDAGSTKCLDAGWNQGETFYIWDCDGTMDQTFTFSDDGSIQFQTADTFCVEVQGWTDSQYLSGQGLPYSSELVQSSPCLSEQLNQKWNLTGSIRDAAWGKCLRNPGSSNENNTLQEMWDCNGDDDQQWDVYLP